MYIALLSGVEYAIGLHVTYCVNLQIAKNSFILNDADQLVLDAFACHYSITTLHLSSH